MNLSAGVNNLFDKDPPLIASDSLGTYGNNNTFPGTYDPLGRYVFVSGSVKFENQACWFCYRRRPKKGRRLFL